MEENTDDTDAHPQMTSNAGTCVPLFVCAVDRVSNQWLCVQSLS